MIPTERQVGAIFAEVEMANRALGYLPADAGREDARIWASLAGTRIILNACTADAMSGSFLKLDFSSCLGFEVVAMDYGKCGFSSRGENFEVGWRLSLEEVLVVIEIVVDYWNPPCPWWAEKAWRDHLKD